MPEKGGVVDGSRFAFLRVLKNGADKLVEARGFFSHGLGSDLRSGKVRGKEQGSECR